MNLRWQGDHGDVALCRVPGAGQAGGATMARVAGDCSASIGALQPALAFPALGAGVRRRFRRLGIKPSSSWPARPHAVGAPAGSAQVNATIALTPRDPAGLAAYAEAVSTSGSPDYHQYLSVAQFAQRFGAAPSEIAAVRSSLAARGLTAGTVSANGLSLPIAGSATKAGGAFSTSFKRYRLKNGRTVYANTSAPALPSNVAGRVQGVFGLDTLPRLQPQGLDEAQPSSFPAERADARRDRDGRHALRSGERPKRPKDTAFTAGSDGLGLRVSGSVRPGDLGAGSTVALYELEPFAATSDIAGYQACYGTSAFAVGTTKVGRRRRHRCPAAARRPLDIEQVLGPAPRTSLRVYEAPNTGEGRDGQLRADHRR